MAYFNWVYLLLAVSCSFSACCAEIRKELRPKEINQEAVIQLNWPVQYKMIDPSRVTQLSWRPRSGFSHIEGFYRMRNARGKEEKLYRNDGDSGNIVTSRTFTNSETLSSIEDKVTASIEERISAWTFLPKENSKSLQVMHYGIEEAKKNYNFFGNKSMLGFAESLMATVVLYLSNATRGGDIVFPESEFKSKSKIWSDCEKSNYALRPIKGNAILFFSRHPNALPDKSSSHGRCPVLEGEIWCATKNFHVRPMHEDIILSESDSNECADEDDNCSQWAAAGECQRNPVYMIGSPDYYGTCRKSCNAC